MEETFQALSKEDTRDLIQECYRKRSSSSFLDALRLSAEDPTEPVDANGKRKLHSLLWTAALVLAGALGVILYFTYKF